MIPLDALGWWAARIVAGSLLLAIGAGLGYTQGHEDGHTHTADLLHGCDDAAVVMHAVASHTLARTADMMRETARLMDTEGQSSTGPADTGTH